MEAIIQTGIFIPRDARSCPDHFTSASLLNDQALLVLRAESGSVNFGAEDIASLLDRLKQRAKTNSTFEKFKNPLTIDDRLCLRTTGFERDEFIYVHDHLTTMRNS